jgi:biopolymer transport protein ExbD
MLVLLVIFIISAPMFTNAVSWSCPRRRPGRCRADSVTLAIDAGGTVYWNNDALQAGELEQRLAEAAGLPQQPELQLRADKDTRYEVVAQVMAAAQSHGLTRIGFVTDPKEKK